MPGSLPAELEYIPCVRTGPQAKEIDAFLTTLQRERGSVPALLGFNEPDIPSHANMSVSEAVELWKQYVLPAKSKFGYRLGSPGISSDPKGKAWLQSFTKELDGKDGIDFIVAHWYGADFAQMASHLGDLHHTFGKRIWLTEFAYSHMGDPFVPTEDMVSAFMSKSLPFLDECPFVERYCYFGPPADVGEWVGRANNFMVDAGEAGDDVVDHKSLTKIGLMYCD